MHPQPYLYPVTLTVGYAVVCERCQTTIATVPTPTEAAGIITSHTCTTTTTTTTTKRQEVVR
jgi:hypothetical protein